LESGVFVTGTDGFRQIAEAHLSSGAPLMTVDGNGERRVLGCRLLISENSPALGQTGDLLLVDPAAYVLVEREQSILSSMHLYFDSDESMYKARFRLDGQPLWRTPITPKSGSTTQSAFVALQAR
jgi:HK97 family phage major capsid protein